MENFRYFLTVNRNKIVTILLLIATVLIGIIIYSIIGNSTTIAWSTQDSVIVATEPTKLLYGVDAVDKSGSDIEVSWKITGGILSSDTGKQIEWILPETEGTYTITATANKKSISKNVTVIGNVLSTTFSDENTVVESNDSDGDGLSDRYEKEVSFTDPNNKDSDSDGVYDGDEIELELDPLKKDSKGDGKEDSKRDLKYKMSQNDVVVELEGKGNLTKTTVDQIKNKTLETTNGVIGNLYNIYTASQIATATISIPFDAQAVSQKGFSEQNLSLYRLLENKGKIEKLDTKIDLQSKRLTATVTSLGKFFVADSSKIDINAKKQIMFVIDNSGSMYPAEEVENSAENDPDFKRVTLSNRLIDKLKGNYEFGAAKFTFEYNLLNKITSDREVVKERISSIETGIEKFTGTYISGAMYESLKEFSDDTNISERLIILLTDGKETKEVEGYDNKKLEEAIKLANSKKVKVVTIGLGQEIDRKFLIDISEKTGGQFYYAPTDESLESIFDTISANLNYNLVDVDNDGNDESLLVKDSGFITKINGFSFENFVDKKQTKGKTYGMALFSKLYYENDLPTKLGEITIKKPGTVETENAIGYNLSSSFSNSLEKPLYEYSFTELNFLSDTPKDYRGSIKDGVLTINNEYKSILLESGFSIYNQSYGKNNSGFKYYENIVLDIENEKFSNLESSDREVINAIYRLDILKNKQEIKAFNKDPEGALMYLVNSFDKSNVVMLKINEDYYVNAIKLMNNNENANVFQIEVYDPNCKGESKYITMERVKASDIQKNKSTGEYQYNFKYMDVPVNVEISIPNVALNL